MVVEPIVAATLWIMFSCYLLFPILGVPAQFHLAVTTLLTAEFVTALMWYFGKDGCARRPCAPLAEAGRSAASIDVPLLSVAVIVLAIIHGVRRHQKSL
jgi:hypothetical protein